jgi:hypothetical protein
MGKTKKVWRLVFGAGVWDSWGFGLSYCQWSKALSFEFIHWYVFVEYWTKEEASKSG